MPEWAADAEPHHARDPAKAPVSPVTGQPTLVWDYTSTTTFLKLVVIAVVLGALAGSVLQALNIPSSGPTYGWLAAGTGTVMGLIQVRPRKLAAGARWLTLGKRNVRVYELTKVDIKPSILGPTLHLTDKSGAAIAVQLRDAQTTPGVWDYVYLGVFHSVANGADVTDRANNTLSLRGPGGTVRPGYDREPS
ncbi:hypothetical protein CFN78_25560 [Amycolatopsis antarctica]|uniref:Uncharacterized protein n=2 Tax=Amycolatopsis antarctica TaxID=1854586 RepID=A0A263CWE9_9PSEU|nr:hypothetical protein CFN78_25560 [Amycolatopsis antarctica]